MELPPALVYLASWATICSGVWALFERAETVVAPTTKSDIANWLRNVGSSQFREWPVMFVQVFDKLFGRRHLSWHCFWRSAVASVASVLVVTLLWGALRPEELREFVSAEGIAAVVAIVFAGGAIINVLPDYVSLLETRFVIGRISGRNTLGVGMLLLMDFVASAAIFLIPYAAFRVLTSYGESGDLPSETLRTIVSDLPVYILPLRAKAESAPDGIFLYSTFFTSAWVWLYAISGLALRVSEGARSLLLRSQTVLDIDAKPLRCIGFVANILVTVGYATMWPLVGRLG
jgi:hypothetical protein